MSDTSPTYLLLDGRQGLGPADGWRVAQLDKVVAGRELLQLATLPAPPVPLVDEHGTFGGLENPTGVAVAPDGAIYVADGTKNAIVKIVRRDGIAPWARFYTIDGGTYTGEQFVYVPTANRLERWPRTVKTVPASMDDVEVMSENVWNQEMARACVLALIGSRSSCSCGCTGGNATKSCGCSGGGSHSHDDHDHSHAAGSSGTGGCGCGSNVSAPKKTASASRKKSKGDCGCGGGTGGTGKGSCSCGCSDVSASGAGTITSEWEEAYPLHLPAGDLCRNSTTYLNCIGGKGGDPRRLNGPRGLAISHDGILYVADTGNHRVQAFGLRGLVLKNIWGRRATAADVAAAPAPEGCEPASLHTGDPVPGTGLGEFNEPWDVTLGGCNLWITDRGNARLVRLDLDHGRFTAFDGTVLAAHFFQVLYGTGVGRRYVWIPARGRVERWSAVPGTEPATPADVLVISNDAPSVEEARRLVLQHLDTSGSSDILVEWEAAYPDHLETDAAFSQPEHLVIDGMGRIYVTDAGTTTVKLLDAEGRVTGGVETAQQVTGAFPPTAITIDAQGNLLVAAGGMLTRFSNAGGSLALTGRWNHCGCGTKALACDEKQRLLICGDKGPLVTWTAPFLGFEKNGTYISAAIDSSVDRCQWHRIVLELAEAIPTGASLTVSTFTSQTLLTDLEVASLFADDWRTSAVNATDFLVMSGIGRYLWLKIEMKGDGATSPALKGITAHFPRQTYMQYLPAVYQADPVSKDFMERFLSIFETVFSKIELKVDDLVRYLDPEGVPEDFLPWLGSWIDMLFLPAWDTETRRRLLRHAPEMYKLRGTPEGLRRMIGLALGIDVRIQEGFKRRRWLFLSNGGQHLWGDAIVSRLQLEQFSTIGDFALVSTGDPLRDPFHVYAHTFAVYVSASDIRDDAVERMLRYLIEREKPAHTTYTLERVQPRFRVGVQSTIGLDTTVGVYPQTVLNNCATLGCDTVLGVAPEDIGPASVRVGTRSRIGNNTVVG